MNVVTGNKRLVLDGLLHLGAGWHTQFWECIQSACALLGVEEGSDEADWVIQAVSERKSGRWLLEKLGQGGRQEATGEYEGRIQ